MTRKTRKWITNPKYKWMHRVSGGPVHHSPPQSPEKRKRVVKKRTSFVLKDGTIVYQLKESKLVKRRLIKPIRTHRDSRRDEVSSSTKSDTSSDNTCCSDKTGEI